MNGANLTTHKQAVIYCRVSDPKQASVRGDGLHSQERACQDYAQRRGCAVTKVFHDSMTGDRLDRPGLQTVLAHLRKHKGTVLIVDHPNRLSRKLIDYLRIREDIEKAGCAIASPNMEFKGTSSGNLLDNVVASVSQYQRQHNAEQTKSRMMARVMNGYWVFQAPVGYRFERVTGRGKMLVRDEPAASVVQEALEGYASDRFENQAEVMRFLQENPLFPKDGTGRVRHQRVGLLLRSPVYAGLIEAPDWDIGLREGQHQPLISVATYKRNQDRLDGGTYAPQRKNLNEDFPLRGFVVCGGCGNTLTACWAKGSHSLHPYYHCPKKGCASYGKSIRRDVIEGEFEALLQSLTPTEKLFGIATRMFKALWTHKLGQGESQAKQLGAQLVKVERQVEQFLERIVDASLPSVISAYESKVQKLEEEKLMIREKIASVGRPRSSFDETLRTALAFLANPWNLWQSGKLEDRRTVLKLTFAERLRYLRGEGFRTANLTLPFNILGGFSGDESEMARPKRFELLTPRFVV